MKKNIINLEWENFEYPLILSNIETHNGIYKFDSNTTITIERDLEYKLKGSISGFYQYKEDLINHKQYINDEDGFPISERITSKGNDGFRYEIEECLIFINKSKITETSDGVNFSGKVLLKRLIKIKNLDKINRIIDWYLGSKNLSKIIFPRFTFNYEDSPPYKFIDNIDKLPTDSTGKTLSPKSLSRDTVFLKI